MVVRWTYTNIAISSEWTPQILDHLSLEARAHARNQMPAGQQQQSVLWTYPLPQQPQQNGLALSYSTNSYLPGPSNLEVERELPGGGGGQHTQAADGSRGRDAYR